MDVVFDIFIEHPELAEGVTEEEDIFYSELHQFVKDRLGVLKEQIDNEELEKEKSGEIAFTCIYILRDDNKFLGFTGYSESLRNKMLGCFSQSDFAYIFNKIEQITRMRKN